MSEAQPDWQATETRLEQFLTPKAYPDRALPPGMRQWPDEQGLQPRDMSWGYIVTARDGRTHVWHGDVILYEGVMPRRVLRYAEVRQMFEPVGAVAAGAGEPPAELAERLLREAKQLPEDAQRVLYENLWGLYVGDRPPAPREPEKFNLDLKPPAGSPERDAITRVTVPLSEYRLLANKYKEAVAREQVLDDEWLALCKLLPEGSSLRVAANSTRLEGCSVLPFIEMYIEELRAVRPTPRAAPTEILESVVEWLDSFDWWDESTKGIARKILERFGAALRAALTAQEQK